MKTKTLALAITFFFSPFLLIAQHTLTINFSEMDPHLGHRFEVRITDQLNAQEVANEVLSEISNASFTMDFIALRTNQSYFIDFYADVNMNGEYDAPPTDHVWRVPINNVQDDVTVDFTHSTDFTDVEWPGNPTFGYLESIWGGKWHNLTFGSTDTIKTEIQIICDSFFVNIESQGLFGNPAVVNFELADMLNLNGGPPNDTVSFTLDAPLTGEILVTNGQLSGDLVHPTAGIGLSFEGNFGLEQMMALYTVKDMLGNPFANGYFYVRELELIDAQPKLAFASIDIVDVSCAGTLDGSISIEPKGGIAPYTYLWSDGNTAAERLNLAAGEYSLTISDSLGCVTDTIIMVEEPEPMNIMITTTNESGPNANDGSASILVTGGTPPYTYSWDNGGNASEVVDLSPGVYTVTVTDANGCAEFYTFEIFAFICDLMIDSISITNESNSSANGGIDVVLSGGTLPYTYQWEQNGILFSEEEDLINIGAGIYILTVQDSVGCIVSSDSIKIENVTATADISHHFNLFPNPAKDYIQIDTKLHWSLNLIDANGSLILNTKSKKNGNWISTTGIKPGMYYAIFNHGQQTVIKKLIILH